MTNPIRAMDIRSTTHTISSVPAPAAWVGGGVLAWDGSWSILNQTAYDEYVASIPMPVLKPYQFWSALRVTGNEAPLKAWVALLNDSGDPSYDPVAWAAASAMLEFSHEYRRDHPLIEAAMGALGITSSELDDLWLYAASAVT